MVVVVAASVRLCHNGSLGAQSTLLFEAAAHIYSFSTARGQYFRDKSGARDIPFNQLASLVAHHRLLKCHVGLVDPLGIA